MLVRGFSKALYSTWFYLPEIRSVFDAGEGINFFLGGRLTKVDTVFLSHGHTDHFTGLLNLLIARNRLGPKERKLPPLSIYYPKTDSNLCCYIEYIQKHLQLNGVPEMARFQPVSPGEEFSLPTLQRHFVRVFKVQHGQLPAVGYCLFKTRDKVQAEFTDRSPSEIGHLIHQAGRASVLEPIDVPLVCYTGDSECAVEAPCQKPQLLLHEATFLNDSDRSGSDHATLAEALNSARKMEPSELILFHFSARYFEEEIRRELSSLLEANPLPSSKVSYALPGRLFIKEL